MKALTVLSVLGVAISPIAYAQTSAAGFTQPKTSWGVPDLQGYWNNTSLTSMQRPSTAPKLVLTEQEAIALARKVPVIAATREESVASKVDEKSSAELLADKNPDRGYNTFWMDPGASYAKVKGEYRSSWITFPTNGMIPYTAAGVAANTRTNTYDDYEVRPLAERCIMSFSGGAGPVLSNSLYNNTYQIVQTPNAVMMLTEMIHDVRVIPIVKSAAEAKPSMKEIPRWGGESVGWYEGNTLVVQTTNSHPKQRSYISKDGKVTERYTRWSDGEIYYEFKVEDPLLYKESWGGEMALRASEPLYEYACHEGNYAFPGIMGGARELDRQGRPHPPGKPIFAGVDTSDGE